MQFKHPELLWALFLLLIPIVIHLFKLRKYQTEAFTNVQVLKQIRKQTNKQSQLKKWLILLMRTLAITCLVMAFTEPYFSKRDLLNSKIETVIYIDNSFSMQLQGVEGTLLQEAVNNVLQQFPVDQTFSLITNTDTFKDTNIERIKNDLIAIPYSAEQLSIEAIYRGANQLFTKEATIKNLILFSDFQKRHLPLDTLPNTKSYFIPLQANVTSNIVIDSAYIASKTPFQYHIKVQLQSSDNHTSTPVSLYNNNELYAKTSAEFKENKATVEFSTGQEFKNGRIEVIDKGMTYDNNLYFSLSASEKINVLSIYGSDSEFLKRIYTPDEFNYNSTPLDQLDYNSLTKQNLIILNQLPTISPALTAALLEASQSGIKICVIPDKVDNYVSSQPIFPFLGNLKFTKSNIAEKHITTIAYQHPLFDHVFESNVSNFQYPKVNSSLEITGSHQSVLSYEDGSDFLIETGGHYVFTAALSTVNSNFKNTPLIVPVFYNMAQQSLPTPTLYYHLGQANTIAVNTQLEQDQVLSVENEKESFIPLQMNYQNYVSITTGEYPKEQGMYWVKNNTDKVAALSFNYPRHESSSEYLSTSDFHTQPQKSATQVFKEIKSENNINELWKWFAIFALVFLCLELLILKYFK
ncbi:BatA domain-containing protein [Galbibacter sp.]|jgi:hypothetical protein|uniref:BatA domain-containing protein n=1 Tax=Galbibacter sp. TaxID=2918471 RepID=UPI003A925506